MPVTLAVAPYRENHTVTDLLSPGRTGEFPLGGAMLPFTSYVHVAGHLASAYCTAPFAGEPSFVLIWDGGLFPRLYHVDPAGGVTNGGELFPLIGHTYASAAHHFGPFRRTDEAKTVILNLGARWWTPSGSSPAPPGHSRQAPGARRAVKLLLNEVISPRSAQVRRSRRWGGWLCCWWEPPWPRPNPADSRINLASSPAVLGRRSAPDATGPRHVENGSLVTIRSDTQIITNGLRALHIRVVFSRESRSILEEPA